MSNATEKNVNLSELYAEISRLRCLLAVAMKADDPKKRRMSYTIEIEPSAKGFRVIVTGVSPEEEVRMAQTVADFLNVLWKGAFRFSWQMFGIIRGEIDDNGHEVDVDAISKTASAALDRHGP